MKPLLLLLFVAVSAGCAGAGPRCARPDDSADRKVAMVSHSIGGASGFIGCVAGFAGVGPWAIPVCIGGWMAGIGGIAYLSLDDVARGKSWGRGDCKRP